jgi:hypothetical protein
MQFTYDSLYFFTFSNCFLPTYFLSSLSLVKAKVRLDTEKLTWWVTCTRERLARDA